MRRVGGRMHHRELALHWQEWYRNFRCDVATMWMNRTAKLQYALDTLQLKHTLSTQVGIRA